MPAKVPAAAVPRNWRREKLRSFMWFPLARLARSGPEVGLQVGLEAGMDAFVADGQRAAGAASPAPAARRDSGGRRRRAEMGVGLEDSASDQQPVLVGGTQAGEGENAPKHREPLRLPARVPEVIGLGVDV